MEEASIAFKSSAKFYSLSLPSRQAITRHLEHHVVFHGISAKLKAKDHCIKSPCRRPKPLPHHQALECPATEACPALLLRFWMILEAETADAGFLRCATTLPIVRVRHPRFIGSKNNSLQIANSRSVWMRPSEALVYRDSFAVEFAHSLLSHYISPQIPLVWRILTMLDVIPHCGPHSIECYTHLSYPYKVLEPLILCLWRTLCWKAWTVWTQKGRSSRLHYMQYIFAPLQYRWGGPTPKSGTSPNQHWRPLETRDGWWQTSLNTRNSQNPSKRLAIHRREWQEFCFLGLRINPPYGSTKLPRFVSLIPTLGPSTAFLGRWTGPFVISIGRASSRHTMCLAS